MEIEYRIHDETGIGDCKFSLSTDSPDISVSVYEGAFRVFQDTGNQIRGEILYSLEEAEMLYEALGQALKRYPRESKT
jgi:hypothetical protein